MPETIELATAEETRAFGERLAVSLQPGDVLLLHGDLGAGKTTLTQGILRGLKAAELAQSPTFILVSEHAGTTAGGYPVTIRHIDLYRLEDPAEIDSFGFADLLHDAGAITIVEWPERAIGYLPERYLLVTISFAGEDQRTIQMDAVPAG